jgi:hypothetical protein
MKLLDHVLKTLFHLDWVITLLTLKISIKFVIRVVKHISLCEVELRIKSQVILFMDSLLFFSQIRLLMILGDREFGQQKVLGQALSIMFESINSIILHEVLSIVILNAINNRLTWPLTINTLQITIPLE